MTHCDPRGPNVYGEKNPITGVKPGKDVSMLSAFYALLGLNHRG